MRLCIDCSNKAAKNRRYCLSCVNRRYRDKDPVRYCYKNLKANAKRRGKFFDLTLEEFREFCIKYNYIEKKGRSATSYTVDREIEELGYTKSNLQALPNRENIKKYKRWTEAGFKVTEVTNYFTDTDGCPF